MNKKLLLLSVLLLTAVVGCKNKSNNSASQGSNSDSTEQVSTDEAAEGTSQARIRQVDPALSGSDALEAIKKNYKGKVAFFDFWATWCGPCRMLGPVIEELATEYEGKVVVGKVDVDNNQEFAGKYGVRNIPTVLVFKDGEVVGRQVGVAPKKTYTDALDSLL